MRDFIIQEMGPLMDGAEIIKGLVAININMIPRETNNCLSIKAGGNSINRAFCCRYRRKTRGCTGRGSLKGV